MKEKKIETNVVTRLMFRLLPVQVLLAAVGAVNGIVSSFFASNYVGVEAMSAVGLYGPVSLFLGALVTVLLGGSAIMCGKYMGKGEHDKIQNVFSLNQIISAAAAILFTVLFILIALNDLTGFMTRDPEVRPLFNQYVLGQSIGLFPFLMGNQLPSFLALENKGKRSVFSSLVYIVVNIILNFLFVKVLRLEAFGLALASSLGLWAFYGVQLQYFLSGKSFLHMHFKDLNWSESREILAIGVPGALGNAYQTLRGLLLNWKIEAVVGTVGISAFAGANNLLGIFWAIPAGMLAVSRLIISVSIGEEDRQTLTDAMRGMLRYYVPIMSVVSLILAFLAVPMTRIFFRDPAEPVYMMTVWGMRILPIAMPFAVICMHFSCYAQASGKKLLVHLLALLDGVADVVLFVYLFIRLLGMYSVYIGNVFNGVVTLLVVIGYAWIKKRHFPKTMDDLMVIPDDFGVPESDRLDLSVRRLEEVVSASEKVHDFCLEKGIDQHRAYLSALVTEEMAGNIVEHGFTKDRKKHSIDVRVVYKNDELILRLKDDCVPFDPATREKIFDKSDITRNFGIHMVYKMAKDIQYQNNLGLNILTIRM